MGKIINNFNQFKLNESTELGEIGASSLINLFFEILKSDEFQNDNKSYSYLASDSRRDVDTDYNDILEIFKNEDLYGLDICIDAVNKLKKEGYPVSFIFNVASTDKLKELYLNYQLKINELGLTDDFLLINEKLSFVKLIERTDIVLRPTNTDGDALTVREALFLGKPVVASDIVERPAGTTLFSTRNADDMVIKLKLIIKDNTKAGSERNNESKADYHEFYKNLIDTVIYTT